MNPTQELAIWAAGKSHHRSAEAGMSCWVATCLVTGRVWEMFDKRDADKARRLQSAKVEPIGEYLARINKEVRT